MKAIMKYPGSKWIIDFFPEHHSYLEPFFGNGAVLFNKARSNIETVNDLDGNVVNLFEWICKKFNPHTHHNGGNIHSHRCLRRLSAFCNEDRYLELLL